MGYPNAIRQTRVYQGGVRADLTALADARAGLDRHALADHGVLADLHVGLDRGGLRRGERHAVQRMLLDQAPRHVELDLHQVRARVYADRAQNIFGELGRDAAATLADQREHLGEVALTTRLAHTVERAEQLARREGVGADVHLPDQQLVVRNVLRMLGLDDALDRVVRRAHDAAVAC